MPSLQIILQQLVESPTSRHRARRSKRQQKSSKTSSKHSPFSPRTAFLEPIDYDRDTSPLLNASHSNTPSMLSAITTNTPSILSYVSFAKSETYLPVLPPLPFGPHPNIAESKSNQSGLLESVPQTVSHRLDVPAKGFRYAVNKGGVRKSIPDLNSTVRGGRNSSRIQKDEHEIYLENLKLLNFGGVTEFTGSEPQQGDDEDWEEIDLRNYGWQA